MSTVYKVLSQYDIEKVCGTNKAVELFKQGKDKVLKKVLWILGLQVENENFECNLCIHRPILSDNNDTVHGYLFSAPERIDEEWLSSQYSSREVKNSLNPDYELMKDMRVMSHVPNFTLMAMNMAEEGEVFEQKMFEEGNA